MADTAKCPNCGDVASWPDGWDVLGADDGKVFCLACGDEVAVVEEPKPKRQRLLIPEVPT